MHNYIDTCCEKLIEMEPVEESCVESDDHESEPTRIVCSTSSVIEISSTTDIDDEVDVPHFSATTTTSVCVKKNLNKKYWDVSCDSDFESPLKNRRSQKCKSTVRDVMSDSDVNSPSKKKNMASSDDEQVMGIPPQKKKKRSCRIVLSDSEIVSPKKRPSTLTFDSTSDDDCDSDFSDKVTRFYNNNPKLPVFHHTSCRYNARKIAEVLLHTNLPVEKIATSRPVCVQNNVTFVVDLDKLQKKEDIRADDLGSWHCNGKRLIKCEVDKNGKCINVINNPKRHVCSGMYTIIRRYYEHMTARDFKKTIAEILDPNGNQINLALVQYVFTGSPHPIISKPHGNSKEQKPFIRTTPSTLNKLKVESKTEPAKQVIHSVTNDIGGVVNSEAVGDLPRNRKQVYNVRGREMPKHNDALLSVMAMCKESFGNENDPFVRIVTSAPEPMCVLCTNSQLFDIERFCTRETEFCPLTIDPTFNLGDFSVTISCYRHLLLQGHKGNKRGPVMIGPMLVHRKKEFSSYHFLASTLVSLRPGLSKLRAFGTDGEEALYQAFSVQFGSATHVRCFLHFRDNCKAKLQELNVSTNIIFDILQDIFGCVVKGKKGLVDSSSTDEFHAVLKGLKEKWDSSTECFYDWFVKYKAKSIEDSMIQPIRVSAGLGDPPEPYYTNDIESINRVVKRKTKYKTCEWPEFCKLAHELVKEQECEVEKAVIGIGEFKFRETFKHFEVPLTKWSSMSVVQRERHIKKVRVAEIQSCVPLTTSSNHCFDASCSRIMKLEGQEFDTKNLMLPLDIVDNMFSKAAKLISGSNCIVPAPGTPTAKLVESKSGYRPHFVIKKASDRYCCDVDCPMWKCSQICSHTIASAFVDNNLQPFLSACCTQPNLYALAKTNTKNNAGRKPVKRKASSKKATKAIAHIQNELSNSPDSCDANPDHGISLGEPSRLNHDAMVRSASTISVVQSPTITANGTQASVNIVQSPCINANSVRVVQSPCINTSSFSQSCDVSIVQSPTISVCDVQTPQKSAQSHIGNLPDNSTRPRVASSCTTTPSLTSTNNPLANPLMNLMNPLADANLLVGLLQQIASNSNPQIPSSIVQLDKLFWVMFLIRNVSRCQGCSGKIERGSDGKALPPPNDLVIQHKEQVLFQNPHSGNFQLSRDYRNVYYHPRLQCIRKKYPTFDTVKHMRISKDVLPQLTTVHTDFIKQEFSIQFS